MSIQFAKINSFQQIEKNYIFIYMDMGQFKKYVTGLGGEGSSKVVTKCEKGEGESSQRVMSPLQKKTVSTIALE